MNTLHSMGNLDQLAQCYLCGSRYSGKEITILDENQEQATFHLNCSRCGAAIMVFMSFGQSGIVSVGMLTDLNSEEAKNFYKTESITSDQIIEVHEYLKKI
jgi:hypothetical protein